MFGEWGVSKIVKKRQNKLKFYIFYKLSQTPLFPLDFFPKMCNNKDSYTLYTLSPKLLSPLLHK